jgi:hypothetical protein
MASISVAFSGTLLVELPGSLERQELGGPQLHRHVGQLEGDALELADLLPELAAVGGPLLGALERALGSPQTVGRHLQARRAEPGIGHLEALVHRAEHRGLRQAAIAELQNAVGVTAVRDVLIPRQHLEPGRALVDEKSGDQLLLTAR